MLDGETYVSAYQIDNATVSCMVLDDGQVISSLKDQVDFGETVRFSAAVGRYCVYGGGSMEYSAGSGIDCIDWGQPSYSPVQVYEGEETEVSLLAECVGWEEED